MTNEEIIEKFERENLSLASVPSRIGAFFVDEIIISFLFAIIYWNQFANAQTLEATILLVNSLVLHVIVLKIIYQSFFVWMYGATPGKMLLKIRVISIDLLDNPDLTMSISRACIRILSEWVLYLGFFWALLNPKRETWHDKIARTLVIDA